MVTCLGPRLSIRPNFKKWKDDSTFPGCLGDNMRHLDVVNTYVIYLHHVCVQQRFNTHQHTRLWLISLPCEQLNLLPQAYLCGPA